MDDTRRVVVVSPEQRRQEFNHIADLECKVRELESEVQRLRSQLPEGMQDCTIRFKSCPLGHGRLTADNWVQHGCPTCERNNLREAGWELCEASGNGELWKIYPARLRWQEVNPR